jgi:hypothetical protein
MFDNRMLRRTSGPKRDEVTGEWRKMHNEKLHNLYSSLNIIRTIKSIGMGWAGHVARMGEDCLWDIAGKAKRKEISRKTKT